MRIQPRKPLEVSFRVIEDRAMKTRTMLLTLVAVIVLAVSLPAQQAAVRRFTFDDFSKVKRVGDPQFSPDGTSICRASSPSPTSTKTATWRRSIARGHRDRQDDDLVDGAKAIGVSFERWAPNGQQIAYLATVPTDGPPKPQVFVVSSKGGASKQITTAPSGVQQLAWSPDSKTIGFATADEPEKKTGYQRWNDSFEVQIERQLPDDGARCRRRTCGWCAAAGGEMKRLTSGTWTLPVSRPPGAPSSMITWTPDGRRSCSRGTAGAARAAACRR